MHRYLGWLLCLGAVIHIASAGDITGKVVCKGVRGNQGAVLYLERVDGDFPPPEDPVVMDQKGLEFHPHILPITVGTTVNFVNSDDVLHNVFSPDVCATKFNLGTYPKGEMRSHTFTEEGCFAVLLCNVHPEMEAWILVLQNPYHAVTDQDGLFRIKDVPPGTYTLIAWHERLKNKRQKVVVPAEGEVAVNFTLTRR
jgi:plastocyanin